jgi:hypothetical protein
VTRRAAAGAAAVLLLALVLASQTWTELPRRVRVLAAFAPKDLAVRRLGGSGTAFDRRYFSFLENVRRSVPASAEGIVIVHVPDDPAHLYLANYVLSPREVTFGFANNDRPSGFIVATYGPPFPPDTSVLARFPEGYVEGPLP